MNPPSLLIVYGSVDAVRRGRLQVRTLLPHTFLRHGVMTLVLFNLMLALNEVLQVFVALRLGALAATPRGATRVVQLVVLTHRALHGKPLLRESREGRVNNRQTLVYFWTTRAPGLRIWVIRVWQEFAITCRRNQIV